MEFSKEFEPRHGEAVAVAPGVRRITVNNPGPFTFHGTNCYLVGEKSLAVIDPGPDDDAQLAAIMAAVGGRPVSHILVSHTHRDHSPLARRLQELTGAPMLGEGPHRPARALRTGEINPLDASGDTAFMPDRRLGHGERIEGDDWTLEALHTPGHAANHLAFALQGSGILFSADHVMAWSTTVVAPPDGSMTDYMASLDLLLERGDTVYFPGHGGPVTSPAAFVKALRTHRKMRERAILEQIRGGDRAIPEIVAAIYRDTDPRLHAAAGLSVLAHLEEMVAKGVVLADRELSIDARYRAA